MRRRDFLATASAFAVSTLVPPALPADEPPVRYAAIGLGNISDIFIRACAQSTTSRITALVTGHAAQKAPKYAGPYNIPASSIYSYDTFDRIAGNKNVDAVYIGLPNSMHCEFTVRAAQAGKHVLCEKPMAISSAECRQMIEACRKANVRLMIGYRVHFDPVWAQVKQLLTSGALGTPSVFQGSFYASQPSGAWRLNRALAGGGSLFDLGIYPLNAARWLLQDEPSITGAQVSTQDLSGRFASVEQTVQWMLRFPRSQVLAVQGSSYGASILDGFEIAGSQGSLRVSPAWAYEGLRVTGHAAGKPVEIAGTHPLPYQFTLEADHFSHCVRTGQTPIAPGEEGLADLLAIEAIYRAAGAPVA